MENVSGLLSMGNGNTFEHIMKNFESLGYHLDYEVLRASDFGVPQNRNRVIIIGSKKKIPHTKLFPTKSSHSKITVKDALSDLCFLGIGQKSFSYKTSAKSTYQRLMRRRKSKSLSNHESANHSERIQKRFAKIPQGMDSRNVIFNNDSSKRDCYRLHPNKPSRTITTLPEDFVHYQKNRIPTV